MIGSISTLGGQFDGTTSDKSDHTKQGHGTYHFFMDSIINSEQIKGSEMHPLNNRHQQYASACQRLLAGLIDWVGAFICGLGLGLIFSLVLFIFRVVLNPNLDDGSKALSLFGFTLVIFPISTLISATIAHMFYTFVINKRGDTPGHQQMSFSIRTTDGESVSTRLALLRYVFGTPLSSITQLIITPSFVTFLILHEIAQLNDSLESILDPFIDVITDIIFLSIPSILVAVPLLVMANHILMAFDSKKRGWHDIITNSVVVKIR